MVFGQSLTNFNESFNANASVSGFGHLGFLKSKNQDDDGLHYNLLGHCAIHDESKMTDYQIKLTNYFENLRSRDPDHFKGQRQIKFSDLFRFRGLLG